MKTMYLIATNGDPKIFPKKVTKTSPKCVWVIHSQFFHTQCVAGTREPRTTKAHEYHDSAEDAKHRIVELCRARVNLIEKNLTEAKRRLRVAKEIKPALSPPSEIAS